MIGSHRKDVSKNCIELFLFACVDGDNDTREIRLYMCLLQTYFSISTSDQTRLPAEFKHITKRRKRN